VLAVAPKLRAYVRQTTKTTPISAKVKTGWLRKKSKNPRSPPDDERPLPDQDDPREPEDHEPPDDREPPELELCPPL